MGDVVRMPVAWQQRLTYRASRNGPKLLERLSNVVLLLEHDPTHGLQLREIVGGMGVVYDGATELGLARVPELQAWLYRAHGLDVGHGIIAEAVQIVARGRLANPIAEYLESVPAWDRVQRLPTWLQTYMGVEPHPVSDRIGAWWLQQAAARGMTPGCQADYMLILEGEQGLGKSQALRALMPRGDWFTDSISQFASKDDRLQLAGRWLVELGELDALTSSSIDRVKSVITATHDHVRPPYGKVTERFPRTCVFAGTTNAQSYLRDTTGNRRFWPVRVTGRPDLAAIERDRDQLWAEAVARERKKVTRWVTEADTVAFADEQAERRCELQWETEISRWVDGRDSCLTIEVMAGCLDLPVDRRDQRAHRAIAAVMSVLGWEPTRTATARGYRRKT